MNKNTKAARAKGFSSMKDLLEKNEDGKIFKGSACKTDWDNPNSKRNTRKNYSKKPINSMAE